MIGRGTSSARLHFAEWVAATRMLTPVQRSVYIDLLVLMMNQRGQVPYEIDKLAFYCGMRPAQFESAFRALNAGSHLLLRTVSNVSPEGETCERFIVDTGGDLTPLKETSQ